MTVREWAQRYIDQGWYPLPLRFGQKELRDKDGLERVYTAEDFEETNNIGIRLVDAKDKDRGVKLVAVDFDAPELTQEAVWSFLPRSCGWTRPSKSISQVLYVAAFDKPVTLKDLGSGKEGATLIEIRVKHQSMAPPSMHPNGEQLAWLTNDLTAFALETPVLRRYVDLLGTYSLIARYYPRKGARHAWGLYLAGFLARLGLKSDEAVKIFQLAGAYVQDPELKDRLDAVRSTFAHPDDDPIGGAKKLLEEMGDDDRAKSFVESLRKIWGARASGFVTDATGQRILSNSPVNIERALEQMKVTMAYNTFADYPAMINGTGERQRWTNEHFIKTYFDIDKRFGFLPPKELFKDKTEDLAYANKYHPVLEYLAGLKWDGTPRIDEWLIKYAGAKDTAYVRAISSIVLIAAVRRVRQPGCKFDELLILESSVQGRGKSMGLGALCPDHDWFSDGLHMGVGPKIVVENTMGVWIVEISELAGNSNEAEQLKASLSRGTDGPVRLAYKPLPSVHPRQFIMIGTTNRERYLKDRTGNRRFWPVTIERMYPDEIATVRDQLWAEAAIREAKGESIRLDPKYWEDAAKEQEERLEEDPWHPVLERLVESKQSRDPWAVSNAEVWNALGVDVEHQTPASAARVASVMLTLGFKRGIMMRLADERTDKKGKPQRCYVSTKRVGQAVINDKDDAS